MAEKLPYTTITISIMISPRSSRQMTEDSSLVTDAMNGSAFTKAIRLLFPITPTVCTAPCVFWAFVP